MILRHQRPLKLPCALGTFALQDPFLKIRSALESLGSYFTFALRTTWLGIRHPIRPGELVEFFDILGVKSLPVTLFAGFFAGLSISFFLEGELDQYGAKMTLGRVIG